MKSAWLFSGNDNEMKRIIYSTEDGGVAVIIPADDSGLTIEQIAAKDVPGGVPFEVIDVAEIPKDRTFRNGWERSGKTIGHNLPRCKLIAHDMRRSARAVEFAPLDIEATIPAQAAKAEAKRQAVRDRYAVMQTAIDAATDVAGLKTALGAQWL